MDTDDRQRLDSRVRRLSWAFGITAVVSVASFLQYATFVQLGQPLFPAPVNVCLYLLLTASTVSLLIARVGAAIERRMVANEARQDRRDGLLYARTSRVIHGLAELKRGGGGADDTQPIVYPRAVGSAPVATSAEPGWGRGYVIGYEAGLHARPPMPGDGSAKILPFGRAD